MAIEKRSWHYFIKFAIWDITDGAMADNISDFLSEMCEHHNGYLKNFDWDSDNTNMFDNGPAIYATGEFEDPENANMFAQKLVQWIKSKFNKEVKIAEKFKGRIEPAQYDTSSARWNAKPFEGEKNIAVESLNNVVQEALNEYKNDYDEWAEKHLDVAHGLSKYPEKMNILSYYKHCGNRWNSLWDSACDEECPTCGEAVSPYKWKKIDDHDNDDNDKQVVKEADEHVSNKIIDTVMSQMQNNDGLYEGDLDELPISFDTDDLSGIPLQVAIQVILNAWNNVGVVKEKQYGSLKGSKEAYVKKLVNYNGTDYLVVWNDNMAIQKIKPMTIHEGFNTTIVKEENNPINPDILQVFADAYMTAALWASTSTDPNTGKEEEGLLNKYEIAPASENKMKQDCLKFLQSLNPFQRDVVEDNLEQAGHDFWLTRNHHGSGFWDDEQRYGKEMGEQLTELSQKFPETNLYIGDDGLAHEDYENYEDDIQESQTIKQSELVQTIVEAIQQELPNVIKEMSFESDWGSWFETLSSMSSEEKNSDPALKTMYDIVMQNWPTKTRFAKFSELANQIKNENVRNGLIAQCQNIKNNSYKKEFGQKYSKVRPAFVGDVGGGTVSQVSSLFDTFRQAYIY